MADVDGDIVPGQSNPATSGIMDGIDANSMSGLSSLGSGGFTGLTGTTGRVYRMRAKDTSLSRTVLWNSGSVDATGIFYTGPGPLTDIVVYEVIG